ncbi:hypothetical protein K1T35_48315 (plasmid) [Pseudonocardia sp. DSM 110487]|uniref:hypothetical protein n=1 Tax=Pseudonocardia sp. DSM 110487 TaxID=2865833 RepID=UPI001C6A085B|nr:hypothetical protein [Pseudonocardia sp. DSM 110487]QYN41153.1 hypothetical protein K1T35_48315 [Pseudonocardia sp. DSM 110487]
MFEREGSAPDILDVDDRAVRRCSPAAPVWVDLAALTQHLTHGKRYGEVRPGGVSVTGLVRGIMWAQVMSDRGLWLGVVTCELERRGAPVMTASALVPQWALKRRLPGSSRGMYGKANNRPTAAQQHEAGQFDPAAPDS